MWKGSKTRNKNQLLDCSRIFSVARKFFSRECSLNKQCEWLNNFSSLFLAPWINYDAATLLLVMSVVRTALISISLLMTWAYFVRSSPSESTFPPPSIKTSSCRRHHRLVIFPHMKSSSCWNLRDKIFNSLLISRTSQLDSRSTSWTTAR